MQAGIQMSNFKILGIHLENSNKEKKPCLFLFINLPQTCAPPTPPSSPGLGQHLVHKQEDGSLWWQLDAFPDDVHELGHRDVRRQQILPLVDVRDL